MVPKSLSVRSYATPENWPNFYQLSHQATGKQSLAWSPVKEKVSVVRFQIDAYKISTKHKSKDISKVRSLCTSSLVGYYVIAENKPRNHTIKTLTRHLNKKLFLLNCGLLTVMQARLYFA